MSQLLDMYYSKKGIAFDPEYRYDIFLHYLKTTFIHNRQCQLLKKKIINSIEFYKQFRLTLSVYFFTCVFSGQNTLNASFFIGWKLKMNSKSIEKKSSVIILILLKLTCSLNFDRLILIYILIKNWVRVGASLGTQKLLSKYTIAVGVN